MLKLVIMKLKLQVQIQQQHANMISIIATIAQFVNICKAGVFPQKKH